MKSFKKAVLRLAFTAISAMAMNQAGAAITLKVTGMEYFNPTKATIQTNVTPMDVKAGEFVVSDGTRTFLAWCVDIFQATVFNESVTDYTIGSASAFGQTKVDMLGRLATEALGKVKDSETSGAFQLAAWEIVNETSGKYDLTTGNFKASNVSGDARELAQTWLKNLPTASTYSVTLYTSASRQDLAVFEKSPVPPASVPEPATTALLGLGIFGFVALRRKQATGNKA